MALKPSDLAPNNDLHDTVAYDLHTKFLVEKKFQIFGTEREILEEEVRRRNERRFPGTRATAHLSGSRPR
jgi:hypothetical protein